MHALSIASFYPTICLEECKSSYVSMLFQFVIHVDAIRSPASYKGPALVDVASMGSFLPACCCKGQSEIDFVKSES